jgi:two-component system chemotaxis sensor kinase CheA
MSIDLTEVRVLFLEESFDNIDIMESNLLDLEIDHIDKELVNSIFRAAHSIKGGAGIFNFENIIHFSHAAETLLDEMRNEEHLITQALIDLLLRSVDVLRMMLSAVQDNTDYDTQEAQNCLLELQKASQANQEQLAAEEELSSTPIPPTEGLQTSTEPLAPEKSSTSTIQKGWHILFKPNLSMLKTGNDPINLFRELNHLGELEVKVDTSQLPALAELDPQACYLSWELTLYGEIERAMLDELFEWVEDECELQITALEPDKSPLSCQSISEPHFSQNQEISLDTDESTKISRPERDKITDPKLDEHDQNLELVKSDEDEKALVTEEKSQPSPEKGLILEKDEMALEKGETESPLDKSETPLIHQDEIALKKRDEPISAVETEIAKISSKETAETKTDETKHTHSVALHLSEANSIRVGIDKVDALINMVGELVITQSMLDQIGENFENARINQLRDGLAQLERNTRELQESVMRIRMLPISFSFNRFPRLVHDLSTQLGKKVELKLSGEQTELDKTVLEKMNDPLVHLVRNALDHGIEMPEQRRTTGKSETGLLHLHAFHQSGNIMIKISDDGAGFDVDKIRSKALEKGLLNANERMTHEQVCEFIFHPGFSTAEQVSDLSGRGVGMDVVRRNIRALGGNIEVKSQQRVGSTFSIRLPLTLAILDGQLVRVGAEIYILPLLSIIESLRVNPKLVNFVAGLAEVYRLREEYIPILRLFDLFGIATRTTELEQGLLVIVEGDGQKIGLFVDELLSQQQIVIKSLESNYQKVEGISGATILGDGSVALILDVAGLIHLFHSRTKIPLTRPLSVSGVRYEQ